MLYDREDRMSRPIFLTEYDIEGSTEKRARAEGLPWPPYVVMGGRVYYSRRLVARWFEQQAGVHQAQPVEMADGDEFWQAGQEAKVRRMPRQARIDGDEANPEEAEAAATRHEAEQSLHKAVGNGSA